MIGHLAYCTRCRDVFRLHQLTKYCRCRRTRAKVAESFRGGDPAVTGPGVLLTYDEDEIAHAASLALASAGSGYDRSVELVAVSEDSPDFVRVHGFGARPHTCQGARPHTGTGSQ